MSTFNALSSEGLSLFSRTCIFCPGQNPHKIPQNRIAQTLGLHRRESDEPQDKHPNIGFRSRQVFSLLP